MAVFVDYLHQAREKLQESHDEAYDNAKLCALQAIAAALIASVERQDELISALLDVTDEAHTGLRVHTY